MKRTSASFAAIAASLLLAGTAAVAQEANTRQEPRRDNAATPATNVDARTSGATVRASKLIGMDIYNPQGKSVGEIHDVVLDLKTGKIRYAAVTYGGFLGIGNKMFAVPFEAFRSSRDENGDSFLVLNVTQESLDGAVGFDEDHWPNFGDSKFAADLDKRYGVERRTKDVDDRNQENR